MARKKKPELEQPITIFHPQIEEMVKLKDDGFSYRAIAEKLDVPQHTVATAVNKFNYEIQEDLVDMAARMKRKMLERHERIIDAMDEQLEADLLNTKLSGEIRALYAEQAKLLGLYEAVKQDVTVRTLTIEDRIKAIEAEYTEVEEEEYDDE